MYRGLFAASVYILHEINLVSVETALDAVRPQKAEAKHIELVKFG